MMKSESENTAAFSRPVESGESRTRGSGTLYTRTEGKGRIPKVSIGLPVYNGGEMLRQAVDSILGQTFTDFELVICDNASTDQTEALCREYERRDARVRYFRNAQNIGAAKNFNRTFELSRAGYFKWMAHDDVVLPTMVGRCVEVLDANPEVVLCIARRRYMDYDGRICSEDPVESFHDLTIGQMLRLDGHRYPAYLMGVMRREAVGRTRLLDPFVASDTVFAIEMRLQGRMWEVPEELHFMRWPDKSTHRAVRKTPRGEAIFLDPLNAARWLLMPPGIKLLVEMVRGIYRSPATPAIKRRAYRDLIEYVGDKFRRVLHPRAMGRYVTQNVRWATQTLSESERQHALGRGAADKAHI